MRKLILDSLELLKNNTATDHVNVVLGGKF